MALGPRVQVWMFPGRAWDKEDTGSVVDLADGGGVGGSWHCKDVPRWGVEYQKCESWSLLSKGSCMFLSGCLNDVQLM